MSTPRISVTSWGTEAARLAAKVEALDRLAQDLATTPGERSNAAAAAAVYASACLQTKGWNC